MSEVFSSVFSKSKKYKNFVVFSPGSYDDITTNIRMEYLIALRSENDEDNIYENEVKI